MATLTPTQSYYLCALNEKGNIPSMKSVHIQACLVMSEIMALLDLGYLVHGEKEKLIINRPWDSAPAYLKPLYDTVADLPKPKDAKGIIEIYLFGFSKKPFDALLTALGSSLASDGYAQVLTDQGLLRNKTRYAPKPEAVAPVVQQIRAELLDQEALSNDTLCLTALLDKSELLRGYFNKDEIKTLKSRLKEIQQSETYASVKKMINYVDGVLTVLFTSIAASSTV